MMKCSLSRAHVTDDCAKYENIRAAVHRLIIFKQLCQTAHVDFILSTAPRWIATAAVALWHRAALSTLKTFRCARAKLSRATVMMLLSRAAPAGTAA